MRIGYKVGCNFDLALLDGLAALNEKYKDRQWSVKELYGSLVGLNPIGTARPDFRLRTGDEKFLRSYVGKARALGIDLNYTLNVSIADPRVIHEREQEIRNFLEFLWDIGVSCVIVAHPLVAQVVNEWSSLPIELSTIMQIRHPRQLESLKYRYRSIQRLCLDVFANRNYDLLAETREVARNLDISLEAIVNEFCIFECPDRNACYDLHALRLTYDETKLFGHYPMGHCIKTRIMQPIEWLYARFILPQWVELYARRFNISSFKITGRTHPTSYLLWVTEQYLSGKFEGNLLELWADVENIGRLESEYHVPRIYLDCEKIPDDFPLFWLDPHHFGRPRPTARAESLYLQNVFREIQRE